VLFLFTEGVPIHQHVTWAPGPEIFTFGVNLYNWVKQNVEIFGY
jgi:hypothetical protein